MSRIQDVLVKARTGSAFETVESANAESDRELRSIDFAEIPSQWPDEDLLVENRIVAAQPDSPSRSVYKMLRTRILHRMRTSNWNVLGVSGSGPGEGKTLSAINLAYSLSHDVNYEVILVDLDLRRPSVHSVLGLEPEKDLESYIQGDASLEEVLVRPGEKRLAVLPNMTSHRDSSEVLSSPQIVNLVGELRSLGRNTITVFDLPPVLAGDDVLAFSPLMDAILLIVAEGICKRPNLLAMQELLKDSEVIGMVLNRSREQSSSMEYYGYY
jgi:Mrp family chromosome partitioning ATPase